MGHIVWRNGRSSGGCGWSLRISIGIGRSVKSKVIDQIYAEDGLAAFRTYERGEVDWISDVDSDLAAEMLARGGATICTFSRRSERISIR